MLQRQLASSLGAIRSSLRKRAGRIAERLAEPLDAEQETDDATEDEEEGVVVAETLDDMRTEIAALERLVVQGRRDDPRGEEVKLVALQACLQMAELSELATAAASC